MMNSIRRALLAGVGAAVITTEKAEETLNDFVQQGRISAKDARSVARQLAKDGKKEFAAVRSEVEDKLLALTRRAGAEAQTRIAALEAKVADLQRQKQEAARKAAAPRPKAKARGA